MFNNETSDDLLHYGTPRHSGRYPWGSGDDPMQREGGYKFIKQLDELRAQGLTDTQIAEKMGMTTTQLRNGITWAKKARTEYLIDGIKSLDGQGLTNTQIGNQLGTSEANVRKYRKQIADAESGINKPEKMQLDEVTDRVMQGVEKTGYLDVSIGIERQLGISRTKLNTVVNKLAESGYYIRNVFVRRLTSPDSAPQYTTIKVLTKDPDPINTRDNGHKIATIDTYIDESGKISNIKPPIHVGLDRITVRYAEDGGADRDGLIELRPGVEDLDLGNSRYAQVRIAAGDDLFLKGMVAYSDAKDFTPGKDIIFNTNKTKDVPVEKVLKKMKDDMDNPFGANISNQKGALNIVNEEGDWDTWSKTMSSQFLSKQPASLVKERLDDTYASLRREFDEISSLTNPVVKKHLMEKYTESMDSKAKHLKAQGLPGTKSHVILPFTEMAPNEVYAPHYQNGDRVVLVRHPHGGKFEIPDLVVNNKHSPARKMLGTDAPDAIGIHPSVAEKLSGADFDGDTVLVIPNRNGQIKTERTLKELKNFQPQIQYKRDAPTISSDLKQTQMGLVSNLITDMTIKQASNSELARAVKHSMVVIDSEKHNLDWKQSAEDNGISALVKKYQAHTNPDTGKNTRGASTLISRSKNKIDISQHTKVREYAADKVRVDGTISRKGLTAPEIAEKMNISERVVKGYLDNPTSTFDPSKYSSGTAVEDLYASHVKNIMKTKNDSMKVTQAIKTPPKSKEAAKRYEPQLKSLDEKLNIALLNAPKERQAQLLTNKLFYENVAPGMDKDDIKKLKKRSLARARDTVGADSKASQVKITDSEWEAIQARAVSPTKLKTILDNADMDIVRKLATPRVMTLGTSSLNRARDMLNKGYTYSEVAQRMGVSTSVLKEELSSQ